MKKLTSKLTRNFNNSISQPQTMKKFYKQSTFTLNPTLLHPLHKYIIKLDDKTMKTPYRHLLAVPSPILALLITSEFNRQDKFLKTGEMPMLALCRTAVDADLQGNIAHHLKNTIQQYLITDTLNFYEDYYQQQYKTHAKPLVQAFSQQFKMKITPSNSLQPPQITISKQYKTWLDNLNNWELIGYQTMTVWLRSAISAYSLIKSGDIEGAQKAATLEQIVQMQQNGQVEEKLMNLNQIKVMTSSGLMMYRFGKLQSSNQELNRN